MLSNNKIRRILKLNAVIDFLDIDINHEEFGWVNRRKVMNSICILQMLGIKDLDYHFSLFISGPYSLELSRDIHLLMIENKEMGFKLPAEIEKAKAILNIKKGFLKETKKKQINKRNGWFGE